MEKRYRLWLQVEEEHDNGSFSEAEEPHLLDEADTLEEVQEKITKYIGGEE